MTYKTPPTTLITPTVWEAVRLHMLNDPKNVVPQSIIDAVKGIDPVCLILAISLNESSGGKWNVPKHENAYAPGGTYYKKSDVIRADYRTYGALASCSWSSWQLMYPVAREIGFQAGPLDLWKDSIALPWVIKYLNARCIKTGSESLDQIADAFNSGSYQDKFIPTDYLAKMKANYESIVKAVT